MFSFLENYNYSFPEPIPLKKKLKDYLEDTVDEKYYINNEKAQKLIQTLVDSGTLPQHNPESRAEQSRLALMEQSANRAEEKLQTVSSQNMTQESAICGQTETVLLKKYATGFEKKTDIATTLMARDYKGFGNQTANGVIERK